MGTSVNIPHLERLVSRQLRLWENQRRVQTQKARRSENTEPFVHIHRQLGSGGQQLAERLARRLRWQFVDGEHAGPALKDRSRRRVVILSSGNPLGPEAAGGLSIGLVGPLDQRIARIARRQGWSQARARSWLLMRDSNAERGQIADLGLYDLVINRAHASLEAAEAAILVLLHGEGQAHVSAG